jgi:hypothetical protein
VETLAVLSAVPFHVLDAKSIETKWQALVNSSTLDEAHRAQECLIRTIEQSHQTVFTNTLALACQNAAIETGFAKIETLPSQVGVIRFSATDPRGRSLVTEIRTEKGETALETEVVGVTDGSCAKILDAYDASLEKQGVKSGPPARKFTGGICELAAAREFLRRKVKPSAAKASATSQHNRRRQTAAGAKVRA